MPKGKQGFQKNHPVFEGSEKSWFKVKQEGYWKGKQFSEAHKKKLAVMKEGNNHPNWKGGERRSGKYVFVYSPNHSSKNSHNQVKRSRLVMEKKLDRHLSPDEIVHHINGVKIDDRPENLWLFSNDSRHMNYEGNLKETYRKWIQEDYNL